MKSEHRQIKDLKSVVVFCYSPHIDNIQRRDTKERWGCEKYVPGKQVIL